MLTMYVCTVDPDSLLTSSMLERLHAQARAQAVAHAGNNYVIDELWDCNVTGSQKDHTDHHYGGPPRRRTAKQVYGPINYEFTMKATFKVTPNKKT